MGIDSSLQAQTSSAVYAVEMTSPCISPVTAVSRQTRPPWTRSAPTPPLLSCLGDRYQTHHLRERPEQT